MNILEFAESITSGFAILSVEDQFKGEDGSNGREDVLQSLLSHFVGDVAHEHGSGRFVVQAARLHLHRWITHFYEQKYVFWVIY